MTTSAHGRVEPPAPDARRPRGTGEPARFARNRPPQRERRGLSLLGVPVATLVSIELIAVCLLVVAQRRLLGTVLAVLAAASITGVVLVHRHNISIGTWLVLRTSYLWRQRETLVTHAEHLPGGRQSPAGARPGTDPAPGGNSDGGSSGEPANVLTSPELEAFFPGMTVRQASMHGGAAMGVVQWVGRYSATLRIDAPRFVVGPRDNGANVPVQAILGALDGQDLGLDSVQVLTQTIVGELDAALTPLLASANAELLGRPRVRNRTSLVTVRIDPATASDAITARGGGEIGIARVLSAALSRIEAAVDQVGLETEVLDAGGVNRVISESCYHQATRYDPIVRWTESVRFIASARMAHRSYVLTNVHRGGLAAVAVDNVFAYALSTQARPLSTGGWSTRTVLRISCRSTDSLATAARELRSAAHRAGVAWQPLDAVQHLGMRATVPIGGI